MKLIICQRINGATARRARASRLIAFRRLSGAEVAACRAAGIRRFFLPALGEQHARRFLAEFEAAWSSLVRGMAPDDIFWRRSLSSKMQEWETSFGYFCLTLFTLSVADAPEPVLFLCSSREMAHALRSWAAAKGWEIETTEKDGAWPELKQSLRDAAGFALRFTQCCGRKLFSAAPRPLPNGGILAVSLFYRSSFNGVSYTDPFFGKFHELCRERGKNCVYLAESLSGSGNAIRKAARGIRDTSIVMPLACISWPELFGVFSGLIFERRSFNVAFMGCDLSALASRYFRAPDSFNLNAEVFYKAARRLSREGNFERMVCLFEGNVHERACMQAFRESGAGAVAGYSHGVIVPLNLKMRLFACEKERPEPDIYVCSGPAAARILGSTGRGGRDIREGCNLKHAPVAKPGRPGGHRYLLALDGMNSSVQLLEWCLEHRAAFDGSEMVLKFHPNVPAGRVTGQCITTLPDNFRVSQRDLRAEIEESSCALYRHSSSGLIAAAMGIPALHLAVDSPLEGDPAAGLEKGFPRASDEKELCARLKDPEGLLAHTTRIAAYFTEFFSPATAERVNDFFS